jgi:molybdopterin/thiamine biosynthesis adenylyltransferase
MSIYRSASCIYGEENFKKIVDSKILVVGAGGIGCEVSLHSL